ncbi:MAG: transcriptional regulator [Nocardioidaceae bacterium]|nr:transcriptional regulator [Nocardioidaceae bacterium]
MESPSPQALQTSLVHDLGFNLGVVFRHYRNASVEALKDIPGAGRGYQILAAAVHGEAANQSALATRLGVDRTVMTYLIDDLETARLIKRQQDPADRRNRQLIATAKGQGVWAAAEQKLINIDEHVLEALPESDRSTFRLLLEQVAARANALDPVADACSVMEGPATPKRRTPQRR